MKGRVLYSIGVLFLVMKSLVVPGQGVFPSTIQLSPAPAGVRGSQAYTAEMRRRSIEDVLQKGFNHFWVYDLSGDGTKELLDFALSRGMSIDYMTSGFERFGRYQAPAISVYDPRYDQAVRRGIGSGLAPLKQIRRPYAVFPFLDEPFHAGPLSFDLSDFAKAEFYKRYGYAMPDSLASVRNDPRKWLDLLNFQSGTFRDGWLKVYHAVKEFDPRPRVVMTHDSHNVFGAGVGSNSKVAMDDVFYWGGDFADVLAYDIYPYMTFDYRYGELGKLPKPRISQMHYTISQLRNVAVTYGKELGFWVGTYSEKWFQRFRGPERKGQYWSEREMSYTAVAQGANFLISPSNYNTMNLPLDTLHWQEYGKAMKVIQQAGEGLLAAPKVKARACFLFPRTQYLQLQKEYFNVGLTFELFLRAFGELDILHEEQVTDDKLNGYKVLVMGDVELLPAAVARHIASFVRKGGVVIADCVPQMDAYKQPLDVMTKLFGVERAETRRIPREGQWVPFVNLPPRMSFPPSRDREQEEVRTDAVRGAAFGRVFDLGVVSPRGCTVTDGKVRLEMRSGRPGIVYKRSGKGRAYLFGFCLQDSYFNTWKNNDTAGRRQLRDLISAVFSDAGVQPHIHSSNPDIEASVRANAREGYVFIINHEAARAGTSVRLADLAFGVGKVVDIASGEELGFVRKEGAVEFDVDAPFGTTRLLKVLP